MKRKKNTKKQSPPNVKQYPTTGFLITQEDQTIWTERVFMGVLLVMGIYLSVVYFGQKAVPNSDFTAFVRTGQQVLHLQMPSSFKRVPLLGILQIAVGKFMFNSPHPILTGALVLNAMLYTISILIFYKIARLFLVPVGSFCLSILAAVNPYALVMVVDPIAETTLVFFLLLTLYLIMIRSRWCYLAAMLASMVRYECFGLIGIALLFDLVALKCKRQKLTAIGIAFVSAIPMILWIIGTKITNTDPKGHYFRVFLNVENRNGFGLIKMLWTTAFSALLQWPEYIRAILIDKPVTQQAADTIQAHNRIFGYVWNCLAAVLFTAGVVGVFFKKQWRFSAMLLFWLGYVCIHMSQNVLLDRYTMPVIWLTLLTAAFGIHVIAGLFSDWLPRGILKIMGILGAVLALVWTISLWPALSKTAEVSPASRSVVYVGLLVLTIGLGLGLWIVRGRNAVRDICFFIIVVLMLVSNQFALSFRLGRGDLDIEFRKVAEWYLENTDGTEKLATTLPGVVNLFLPEGQKNAVHTNGIPGETLQEFAQNCRKKQVRYVAWDSRLGFAVRDVYYEMWGLKKIHLLGSGQDVGPFQLITKIEATPRRYIFLYRLNSDALVEPSP